MRKKIKWDISILFVAVLIAYSLLMANQGLTVTDTGYNYGNFVYFDSLDIMWKFSTYLATAIGAVFTHLPFGSTMLGLNIYTGLVKAAIAVIIYFVCIKEFKMKKSLTFAAEMVALGYCWCPTALLYNYVTYLLFNLGAIFLCLAVKKSKNIYYVLAGACLGMNVMVRLPNLAEMALILALWFYCFITKETFMEALKRTGLCVLGYVAGIAVIFLYICIRYGAGTYFEGISQILSMSSTASSYSLKTMLIGDIRSYIENSKWLFITLAFIAVGTLFYAIFPKKLRVAKRCIYLACNLLLIHVFRMLHMFGYIYHDYQGIYYVGIFFLIIAGVVGLYVMFFGKENYQLRMLAISMGIIILITPLGSNNYLFSAVNNIFLAVPFVFHSAYKLITACRNQKEKKLSIEPLTITLVFLLGFISMQGLLFGSTFVFRDGDNGDKRTGYVADNEVLSGMHTTEANAKALSELNQYLNRENLKGSDALLYYNVPSLSFYMNLQPAISSTWPDLDSFTIDKFSAELTTLLESYELTGYKPIIITGCSLDLDHPKVELLKEHVNALGYELEFHNESFNIYR